MTEIVERVIATRWDPASVHAYLLDFTHATEWDSGTVECERVSGDGGLGTRYRNVSRFLGRETELDYVTEEVSDDGFTITGTNKTVESKDIVRIQPTPDGGATVIYRAEMRFKGLARLTVPALRPFLTRLGDDTAAQLSEVLERKAVA